MEEKLRFITLHCSMLEDATLKQCSDLFSNHYGVYSGQDGIHKKGQRIRLGMKYYMNIRNHPYMYVSLCYSQSELIGQAFYLKKTLDGNKVCTWVTQLLVNKYYRGRGVASRLLHSAWGFSDYFAWGLATANALTVKALEGVTWRKVDPAVIAENIDVISQLCDEIPFTKSKQWQLSDNQSQIFTNFFPEQEKTNTTVGSVYIERLGTLAEGCEWLAFTFRTQPMLLDDKHLKLLFDFSAQQINDAYGRMDVQNHHWTKSTTHEIDYVTKVANLKERASVLDLGCGIGRHTIELARRGMIVTAVEPSEKLITQARKNAVSDLPLPLIDNITFLSVDGRKKQLISGKFDAVICLYDVIGSYRKREDNISFLHTIYDKLKKGGYAVVSIMNMELTEAVATQKCEVKKETHLLLKLKPSRIMQQSGNIFNPDYFVLDTADNLVYRKEQFEQDGSLSTEYIIADYRFRREEFASECRNIGFEIVMSSYVQLGHWDILLSATDPRAKEILFVLKKN